MKKLKVLLFAAVLSCGISPEQTDIEESTQEIIGGITDNAHPYVVAVGDNQGGIDPFCTGTVISKRTVITAGHCFGGINRVFFGGNAFSPTQTITVLQEIRFAGFSNQTLHNDLTILQLASDAPVQPAPLLRSTMANNATFIGPDYTFVGYGVNNGVNQTGFGTKRVVTFPIQAVGAANITSPANRTVDSIDATQFYYAFPNRNTCNGDSGGPAFFIQNKVETHAGVTSFGDGDCVIDGVQQRTDAPNIAAFIQSNIDAFEPNDPCRNNGTCNESCNTNGQVKDADCQVNHCGQDGICAQACVAPIDPDCTFGFDLCGRNGLCDPNCGTLDPDCAKLCGAEGTCIDTCQNADPDCGAGAVCGNTVVEATEQCDDGNASNADACINTCLNATCGDTFVRTGVEQCDDGNTSNTDACINTCQTARCGDGFVRAGTEQCDDSNTTNTDACTNTCQTARCGDGIVRAGTETCDDGNNANGDGCSAACANETTTVCGNGIKEGAEQCDDGNQSNSDACLTSCQNARCGDGLVRTGVEQCDDGNATNGDGCSSGCTNETPNPVCGDGILQPGEQCDDGNNTNNDNCRNSCVLPFCGDGVTDANEDCDDANAANNDSCIDCSAARCGDGIVQNGVEQCDDNNAAPGDGCGATCQIEAVSPPTNNCSTAPASGKNSLIALLFALFGLVLYRRRRN
jgi:MYXO-CTERM domain-containing protein